MIYIDNSALVKLVSREDVTEALRDWLDTYAVEWRVVSSALTRVELTRAARRKGPSAVDRVPDVLRNLGLFPITEDILDSAGRLLPAEIRSLDAIHLATALSVASDISAFCCYDDRLGSVAQNHGFPVTAPGK